MVYHNRIPPGEICYRCGNKAELRERDSKEIETGKYELKKLMQCVREMVRPEFHHKKPSKDDDWTKF